MDSKMKILIIGCGQIGSRHLQAVATLENISEVHIVEPSDQAVQVAKTRLADVKGINKNIKFSWFQELNDYSAGGDICIIATTAKVRPMALKAAAGSLKYRKFILEKIVCQSAGEYSDLMQFIFKSGIQAWVNCQTRAYAIHKYIKSCISGTGPIMFANTGGNWGLACNGIHYADLFIFYDGTDKISAAGAKIDAIIHSSKRGPDVFDLSGSLYGYSDKGSHCTISYAPHHMAPDLVTVSNDKFRFVVDHIRGIAYESRADKNWEWRRIPIEENLMVSSISRKLVSDILEGKNSGLPTLAESFPAHSYILDGLLPHFNKLLKTENKFCPVT
jgi:predicted dehydrogenase